MKKLLLLLFSLFICAHSFAQDPDPELFKTWYLTHLIGDLGFVWPVENVSPRIDPTLTITETLSFSGIVACNTYSGTLSYDPSNNYFETLTFERTFNTCPFQVHNDFETFYFEFFIVGRSSTLWVTTDSNGAQRLDTLGPWYPFLALQNSPLSVSEREKPKFVVFPNPTINELNIVSINLQIEKINVYSMSGKQVLEIDFETESVDVSSLSEGIYFIEITSSEGKSQQKFIKQ